MVREEGTVVSVANGQAIVAVVRTSACQSCRAKQGCGQAVLSDWGDAGRQAAKNHFVIPCADRLSPGDRVTLGIEEDTLSRAAFWMYLWPLLCAFALLLSSSLLGWAEPVQLLAAAIGGGLAFALTRHQFRRAGRGWTPMILAVEPAPSDLISRTG